MIVTVTLNPSFDRTLSVPSLVTGGIHRARVLREDLGGKGINVSRALRALGIESEILGFFAGRTGRALARLLDAAGYDVHAVAAEGEARQNLTLYDEAADRYTKINEPGPTVDAGAVARLEARARARLRPGDVWVLSGSLPPGAPGDLYARLAAKIAARGAIAFVDASGPALAAAVAAEPYAIKLNSEEASELLGRPLVDDGDHERAALELLGRGIARVAITRGARGLVLATGGKLVVAKPPTVTIRSPIGAGDAALAGLLWAERDACGPAEAARRAVACGTAAAMQEGTGVGDRLLVQELLPQISVRAACARSP